MRVEVELSVSNGGLAATPRAAPSRSTPRLPVRPVFRSRLPLTVTTAYVVTRNNTLIPIDTANNTTQTPIPAGPFGPDASAIAIH
jgi:hypothetical protein